MNAIRLGGLLLAGMAAGAPVESWADDIRITTGAGKPTVRVVGDEDGGDTPGLHANFTLSASGELVTLVGPDAALNPLLDQIGFGSQAAEVSYGRRAADPTKWGVLVPTPGTANP